MLSYHAVRYYTTTTNREEPIQSVPTKCPCIYLAENPKNLASFHGKYLLFYEMNTFYKEEGHFWTLFGGTDFIVKGRN